MKGLITVLVAMSMSACCIPKGETGSTGSAGTNGVDGAKGDTGIQGIAGINGTNGTNAPVNPYDIAGLINPCGDAPGIYDEVFIKLNNGIVLASFSANYAGDYTRFVALAPGTYVTTDVDSCVFTINSSGVITFENHHYN